MHLIVDKNKAMQVWLPKCGRCDSYGYIRDVLGETVALCNKCYAKRMENWNRESKMIKITRTTPEKITKLEENQIFIFGSNTIGKHGKGAAKTALAWGAKFGQGNGLQGKTYGIPTKDHKMQVLPVDNIKVYVDEFLVFANNNPKLTFLVTEIGCGLAGYKPKVIAPLFRGAIDIKNIHLPEKFWHRILDERSGWLKDYAEDLKKNNL